MENRNDMPDDTAADESAAGDPNGSVTEFFGTASDVVDRYTHCALCGANLHFSHITDFVKNLTQETAKCPECGVRIRQVMHRLQ